MTGDASRIVRIASRGDGVTADGRHIPLATIGDTVGSDGIVDPGPAHRAASCRHYPRCGGCQMQHVADDDYRVWLGERIASALQPHVLTAASILPAYLSPPRSRRRASLKAARIGPVASLGFHQERTHTIIDMKECAVLHPALFAAIAPLRAIFAQLLPRKGQGGVQLTLADQGLDVLLSGITAEGLAAHDMLQDFASGLGIARLAIDAGDGPEDRWVPEPVTITLGGIPVALPHAAFLQATADGETALVDAVRDSVGPPSGPVADLFSGLGTFALALSTDREVVAVEAGRAAVLALQSGANRYHRPVTVQHRDLYRRPLTRAELRHFSAVVLDPPRAGAEEQVRELAGSAVPLITYVSCNPASFARDAAILAAGGYRIDWVRPVGQFRWSTHVELVARLVRAS